MLPQPFVVMVYQNSIPSNTQKCHHRTDSGIEPDGKEEIVIHDSNREGRNTQYQQYKWEYKFSLLFR